jgi:hypothetical protein
MNFWRNKMSEEDLEEKEKIKKEEKQRILNELKE